MNTNEKDPFHTAGMLIATLIGTKAGADVVVLATPAGMQVHVLTEKAGDVVKANGGKCEDSETDRDGAFKLLTAWVDAGCKVLGLGGDGEPAWLTNKGKGGPETVPEGATIQ